MNIPSRILFLAAALLLLHGCAGRSPDDTATKPATPKTPPTPPDSAAPAQPAPGPVISTGPGIADRPDVQAFIGEMSRKHGFNAEALSQVFAGVNFQEAILTAMARPYEAKPWYAYKKLFLTDARIQGGIEFKQKNAQALADAERKYGVSPDIITAIIGVESSYGKRPGNYRVIDALSTLGFDYPKRGEFFRSELAHFLLLCRDEGIDPFKPIGSYAGAMGMPQFMPSSFRRLAADGDGDGRRDIWNNPADAIASVARYFAANGWQTGEPIAVSATVGEGVAYQGLVSKSLKPDHGLAQFVEMGITPAEPVNGSPRAALVKLEEETRPAFWLGFQNLYAITRYNHSPLYAVAAYELSKRIASAGAQPPT
ncbi:MAG: lytic murein transglycosylase B [Candidatus Methylumidiphilus sp.]